MKLYAKVILTNRSKGTRNLCECFPMKMKEKGFNFARNDIIGIDNFFSYCRNK